MLNNYKFNEFLQATTYAEKVTCSEHTSKYLRVTATHVEDITPTFSGYRPPGTTRSREAIVAQRKVVATKSSSHFRLEPNGTCAIRPRLLRKLRCEQLAVPQTRFGKTCFGSQALPNLQWCIPSTSRRHGGMLHVSRLFCTPAPKSDNACLHVSCTPPPTSLRGTTKHCTFNKPMPRRIFLTGYASNFATKGASA